MHIKALVDICSSQAVFVLSEHRVLLNQARKASAEALLQLAYNYSKQPESFGRILTLQI